MLEIQIHNGVSLDLPEDFRLNMICENPLMLEDRIPAPYSVQFEVPSTIKNLQVFGMPNRIAANGLVKKLPADIIQFGFIVSRGELWLTAAEENPKLQFIGNAQIADIDKNLNQLTLEEYDYGLFPVSLDLGFPLPPVDGGINYFDSWATTYTTAMITAATTGVPFAIAPMKIKGTTWEGEDTAEGVKNSLLQYINFYNPLNSNFYVSEYNRAHTPILPQPYLKDIVEAVFGTKLENNPFAEGDFASLVIPTFNHKYYSYGNLLRYYLIDLAPVPFFDPLVDDYSYGMTGWANLSIRLKSFQQTYPFIQMLKNVLKMFSMTMFSSNKFRIEKNDDIMAREVIVNWDDKIAGTMVKGYEVAKDYLFSYGDTTSVITTNVNKFANMNAIYNNMINGEQNIDKVLQDESTGGIYKMNMLKIPNDTNSNQKIIRSEVQQSPLCMYYEESEREKYEVTSEVKPIDLNIHPCWGDAAPKFKYHWLVPEIEIKDIKSPPYIMFRTGLKNIFGARSGSYPQLMAHNYDQFGTKVFDFSLLPMGADGLITKFHSSYKAWIEKDKLRLKVAVQLLPAELRNLDLRDKYHIGGRLFYIEKLEYEWTNSGRSLVEADLIEC